MFAMSMLAALTAFTNLLNGTVSVSTDSSTNGIRRIDSGLIQTLVRKVTFPISSDDVSHWEECALGSEKYENETSKYSTLSIKRELEKLGKWAAAKSLMEQSGVWDDYILANYLAANDPVFMAAKAAIVAQGILTQSELDALLPKCVWTAE